MIRSCTIIFIASLIFACNNSTNSTLEYQTLAIDTTNTHIFSWDTSRCQFPKNSDPLSLSGADIFYIDSLLRDVVDSFNIKISPRLYNAFDTNVRIEDFFIDLRKYRKQYIPYQDVNGQRILTVYAFCDSTNYWKTEIGYPRLHGGVCNLQMPINLTEKSRSDLRHGGFG